MTMNRNSIVSVSLGLLLLGAPVTAMAGGMDNATDSAKKMIKSGSEKVESTVKKGTDDNKKTVNTGKKKSKNPLKKIKNPF
jgi:hypothetical protein